MIELMGVSFHLNEYCGSCSFIAFVDVISSYMEKCRISHIILHELVVVLRCLNNTSPYNYVSQRWQPYDNWTLNWVLVKTHSTFTDDLLKRYRLLDSLVVEWHRVREVPGSILSQGPRHTKDVIKMVPVVPLFSTQHWKGKHWLFLKSRTLKNKTQTFICE